MQEIMAEVECRFECKKRGRGAARRPRLEREREHVGFGGKYMSHLSGFPLLLKWSLAMFNVNMVKDIKMTFSL